MQHKLSKEEFKEKLLKRQEKLQNKQNGPSEIDAYIAARHAQYLHLKRVR